MSTEIIITSRDLKDADTNRLIDTNELNNSKTTVSNYTPFHMYNGTPSGVPQDVKGQQLPINQLKGNPPTEDCSVSNVHRCKQVIRRILLSLLLSVLGSYILLCIIEVSPTPSIKHQANAWSSITYALIDGPITVRFPLYILSVASFNLWAYSTPIVNFIDVTCIFWTIIIVTIALSPDVTNSNIVICGINVLFILYIITIISISYTELVLMYYEENLVIITGLVYFLCGVNMSTFYIRNPTFVLGIGAISVGFICKLLMIYQDQYWGTSIFHIITAIGIGILLRLSPIRVSP